MSATTITTTRRSNAIWIILALVSCINFAAHLAFYPQLPPTIPVHWNMAGKVDGYGPRWVALVLDALPLVMLALIRVVPRIDPKGGAYEKFSGFWHAFVTVAVLFFCALTWITEAAVFGLMPRGNVVPAAITGLIGAGLIAVGNYLPRVRQNYTFGIKTPWALADERCWQRTQHMGGITFIVMGAAMLACAVLVLLTGMNVIIPMIVVLLGGVAWTYAYSYLVYAGKMR